MSWSLRGMRFSAMESWLISHCDIAWAGALSTLASTRPRGIGAWVA